MGVLLRAYSIDILSEEESTWQKSTVKLRTVPIINLVNVMQTVLILLAALLKKNVTPAVALF